MTASNGLSFTSSAMRIHHWPIARELSLLCLAFGVIPLAPASGVLLNRSTEAVREHDRSRHRHHARGSGRGCEAGVRAERR